MIRELRMSEYTREEILKLIEESGGPEGFTFVAGNRIRRSQFGFQKRGSWKLVSSWFAGLLYERTQRR